MGSKSQFPALILASGLALLALALLSADKIGEGLILAVGALLAVRLCSRRCADAHLARLHAQHGDHMD